MGIQHISKTNKTKYDSTKNGFFSQRRSLILYLINHKSSNQLKTATLANTLFKTTILFSTKKHVYIYFLIKNKTKIANSFS